MIQALTPEDQTAPGVERLIRAHTSAAAVCLISASTSLDRRLLTVGEALQQVVGSSAGTVVSVEHGRVAYFEGEDRGARWLLLRSGR